MLLYVQLLGSRTDQGADIALASKSQSAIKSETRNSIENLQARQANLDTSCRKGLPKPSVCSSSELPSFSGETSQVFIGSLAGVFVFLASGGI